MKRCKYDRYIFYFTNFNKLFDLIINLNSEQDSNDPTVEGMIKLVAN